MGDVFPRRELYKSLARLQLKLEELVNRKDNNWWRQFYMLHKADHNCPYLGAASNQLNPDFILKELDDLLEKYSDYKRSK